MFLCLTINCSIFPCESQPHKGHLTSKPNYRQFPSYLLCTPLLIPFHLLPSPVYPTGFSFCFFPGFVAIFTLLSSINNNNFTVNRMKYLLLSIPKLFSQFVCHDLPRKLIQNKPSQARNMNFVINYECTSSTQSRVAYIIKGINLTKIYSS